MINLTLEQVENSNIGEREKVVLIYRFGLGNKPKMTLEAVGKMLGVTRERIRQMEAKALERLSTARH